MEDGTGDIRSRDADVAGLAHDEQERVVSSQGGRAVLGQLEAEIGVLAIRTLQLLHLVVGRTAVNEQHRTGTVEDVRRPVQVVS